MFLIALLRPDWVMPNSWAARVIFRLSATFMKFCNSYMNITQRSISLGIISLFNHYSNKLCKKQEQPFQIFMVV